MCVTTTVFGRTVTRARGRSAAEEHRQERYRRACDVSRSSAEQNSRDVLHRFPFPARARLHATPMQVGRSPRWTTINHETFRY